MAVRIRPLDATSAAEVDLVAQRMRATLIEVLGEVEGGEMYTLAWLRERVVWHLDAAGAGGQVLLAELPDAIVGHTMVRVEPDGVGLFSTSWVMPSHRRGGIAAQLVSAGEVWLADHGATHWATDTAEGNAPLRRLFAARGYAVVFHDAAKRMVRLQRVVTPRAPDQR